MILPGLVTRDENLYLALLAGLLAPSACGGDDSSARDVDFGIAERPANPTCLAPDRPPVSSVEVELVQAFPQLPAVSQALFMTQAPEHPERFYLVERQGRILTFTGDGSDATVFAQLDVNSNPGEGGLLGLAFHPDFEQNRQVFASYTGGDLESRVARFTSADGLTLDLTTEKVLLRQNQPAGNHNGGWIGFGPQDGYLYIALGDGGGGGDPFDSGQDRDSLLAKVLRIDVDNGDPYAIPADNPFVGKSGRDEIFAWGLRNPWRLSFDPPTGRLWAGDVGQGTVEEIDIIVSGANYGWSVREGDQCYDAATCPTIGLTDPVATYGRSEGVSVTGGYVYRGSNIPELEGRYIFGDFGSGTIWTLREVGDGTWQRSPLLQTNLGIASFAVDAAGEVYVIGLSQGVFRLQRTSAPPPDIDFPQRLSQTGCMDSADPSRPGSMLIPYQPSATLWSDDAGKERWLALPDDEAITVAQDGDFDFPIGTVLIKQFTRGDRRLETRLYMRHPDGDWGGYTYRWNDDQSDAILLPDAGEVNTANQLWRIPSRAQCQQCHTEAAGRSLGLEVAQLNNPFIYPGESGESYDRRANQLATLEHIGMLTGLPDPERRDALPAYDDASASVESRARSYLHTNCSNCHRPGGIGRGDVDLRYFVSVADSKMCGDPTIDDFGLSEAKIVAPGTPERSVLLHRMNTLGDGRMPQLGTEVVDPTGTQLVKDWITGLTACQ